MRCLRIAGVLIALCATTVAAQGTLAGAWRTVVTPGQPHDRMPKMFGDVTLDLQVDGTTLTGTATMGDGRGYPGSAPIHDGTIEGNRFSFKWTGNVPSAGGVPLRYGVPNLTFTGTIDGDRMKLSMDGDYRMDMEGERLPPQ